MEAREELDILLNEALEMAAKLIQRHGAHIPFGMAITSGGDRINVAADDRDEVDPDVLFAAVMNKLERGASEGSYRAVALARNVEYQTDDGEDPVDAIQVTLDHVEGGCCTCYLPYTMDATRGLEPGEFFAAEPEAHFF